MADIVWKTLELYDLTGRVLAFMMDNASNNDTFVAAIEKKCIAKKIKFSAQESRLRCLPHTIHLAALQLLESIGAVEKNPKKKTPYQESATVPTDSDELDAEAAAFDEENEEETTP
ncbi:hypothetical protein B0H16DRAFT_1389723, partial [Mycena metata]